jgi:hypothetical protein
MNAILNINPPGSQVPLTSLTSNKVKFEWYSSHQQAFDKFKKVIGTEIQLPLCYPYFNKTSTFHLYTSASDHQSGAVIMQNRKSLAFYLPKLNKDQTQHTTTERSRELLSAIETYKAARLQGCKAATLQYPVRLPHHSLYRP